MNITIVFGNTSEVAALPMPIVIATLQADLMISTDQMSSKFIGDLLEAHGPVLEGHILIVTTDLSINGRYLSEWAAQFPQITSIRHAANWHDQYKAMRGPAAAFQHHGENVTIEVDGVKFDAYEESESVSENDPNVRDGLTFGDLKATTISMDADPKEVARFNEQFKRWAAEKLLPRSVIMSAIHKFSNPPVVYHDEATQLKHRQFDNALFRRMVRTNGEDIVNVKGI